MKSRLVRPRAAQFGYFLTLSDCLPFLDEQSPVIGINRQQVVVVFDDQ